MVVQCQRKASKGPYIIEWAPKFTQELVMFSVMYRESPSGMYRIRVCIIRGVSSIHSLSVWRLGGIERGLW